MAKKIFIIFIFILCLVGNADAATLKKIRYKPDEEKLRVVLELEGESFYRVDKGDNRFSVVLLNCDTKHEDDRRFYNIKDWTVRKIEVKKENKDIAVNFPLDYPVQYKIFALSTPSRLVIDIGREFFKIDKVGEIISGLDYYYVTQSTASGFVTAHVLSADPKKVEIFPGLAMRSPTFFQSLMNIFTPWQKIARIHFHREKVSTIVDKNNAVAGINGTYFAESGCPLGVLVINGELISYPIYNRTALIIKNDYQGLIDQIVLDAYVEINGNRYAVTGVNEPRESDDVIVYTKHYGELTGTNPYGYELTIQNNQVITGYVGNSRIPDKGYVISFSPSFVENLMSQFKVSDKVKIQMRVIPFTTNFSGGILHVLGGGPRLLKGGQFYVSKRFEKFKSDVASGRAARSAVGVDKNGKILLVAVDGKFRKESPWKKSPAESSIGMTLEELADFMKCLGAADALNLDGGSSSTMVINGKVVNTPVSGEERPVSSALLIRSVE